MNEKNTATLLGLMGWWRFDTADAGLVDLSGNGHDLVATGAPQWTEGGFGGGYTLDGDTQWLSTKESVVRSDESFSVAAWVRLDSAVLGSVPALKPDWYAVTAGSQDGPSHSPFYLGVRLIDNPINSMTNYTLRWNFTAAPVDGSETGPVDWVHAHSGQIIEASELDQWVLLVGVYDLGAGVARLYVPGNDDRGETPLPENWPAWRADGPLRLGQALFRDNVADQWPGSVGQVRVYSGVLTERDAASLHAEDRMG